MKKIIFLLTVCMLGSFAISKAQETEVVSNVFEDTRVVNGHSVETTEKGGMKFIIAHRFGRVNGGVEEFFGFDESTIRIGLDYGLADWLTIGIGRSSLEKTVDGFLKLRLLRQQKGGPKVPFSIVYFTDMAVNTLPYEIPERDNYLSSKFTFAHQLLIARKISDRLSVQLSPSLVHRNFVRTKEDVHDILSVGIAPQFRLSKVISLSAEYYYTLPDQLPDDITNSLAVGINIHTNGHVFQLHFGNSRGMIEKFFITETRDKWEKGEIHFGFNITRDFQIRGKKY